ncbi:IS66 family insertion sequence hypothetical protein [Sinorhizobium fredii]|uniref:Transposase n=1 Tax=Rhizobium fredii TaxID=380 RepID=A0A844A9U5_RHIFR|nr:IS66 family insertion sequence hypothetical protein [Sinorhizobium fredii]
MITSVERRRGWSREEKERLVAATLEPGASVSEIAHSAGIHVSQRFRWRKELCQISAPSAPQLVPVEVVEALPAPAIPAERQPVCRARRRQALSRSSLAVGDVSVSGKLRPFSGRSSTASARRFRCSASRWRCAHGSG